MLSLRPCMFTVPVKCVLTGRTYQEFVWKRTLDKPPFLNVDHSFLPISAVYNGK